MEVPKLIISGGVNIIAQRMILAKLVIDVTSTMMTCPLTRGHTPFLDFYQIKCSLSELPGHRVHSIYSPCIHIHSVKYGSSRPNLLSAEVHFHCSFLLFHCLPHACMHHNLHDDHAGYFNMGSKLLFSACSIHQVYFMKYTKIETLQIKTLCTCR